MARMWTSGSRPEAFVDSSQQAIPNHKDVLTLATSPRSLKRKASSCDEDFEDVKDAGAKRPRVEYSVATPPETPSASSSRPEYFSPSPTTVNVSSEQTDRIADLVNEHFGTEILLRHQELRFINQELAKCQAALEQLRRCHLIPYPTTCPTPQQMLDIVDGNVPAVQSKAGGPNPQWAPPYGVVDGPYARHYAKWLIPDPKFDGQFPEWVPMSEAARSVEGRSTRNSVSFPEGATLGKRVARGQLSQKLPHPIPAAPKTKGPCIIKRNDGVVVKLVCFGCQREDFSSTQGFINHVRISHSTELKSHEEAAIRCGHPIDDSEIAAPVVEEKASGAQISAVQATTTTTGTVHPLARTDATADQNAYAKILQNIDSSLKLFHQGKLPGVTCVPSAPSKSTFADVDSKPSKSFVGSSETPFLSQLLQGRKFKGDLTAHVEDAKIKMDLDEYAGDDDSDDGEPSAGCGQEGDRAATTSVGARVPVPATLGPARAVPSATTVAEQHHPTTKGRSAHLSLDPTASRLSAVTRSLNDDDAPIVGDLNVLDQHSPHTAISNSAPSLTSDDGGDDSDDDASSSEASDADALEEDITEVNPDFHEDHLAQHAAGTSNGTQKKDDSKHVTFVTPVPGKASPGVRRKANV